MLKNVKAESNYTFQTRVRLKRAFFFYLTHYLFGVDVNTGIFEADVVRNILDLYVKFCFGLFGKSFILHPMPDVVTNHHSGWQNVCVR